MPNIVNCRSCQKEFRVIAKKYVGSSFERGILCISCWNKPTSLLLKGNGNSVTDQKKIIPVSTTSNVKNEKFVKFEIGSFVYFNTNNNGVMKGEITKVHEYGEGYTFYDIWVEKFGRFLDYLSDSEIFLSESMAQSGPRVKSGG